MGGKRGPAAERFWRFLPDTPEFGCWLWAGGTSVNGYGQMAGVGMAHRIAYELMVGPIPDGAHVDHLCTVRRCCRPDHLEAVTQAENNRRSGERLSHCLRGHERIPENTATRPNGSHYCKACRRVAS